MIGCRDKSLGEATRIFLVPEVLGDHSETGRFCDPDKTAILILSRGLVQFLSTEKCINLQVQEFPEVIEQDLKADYPKGENTRFICYPV